MQTSKTPTSRSPVASPTAPATPDGQRRRQPWADRWLVEALQQAGHPAVDQLTSARTAWEALEAAGATTEEIHNIACTLTGSRPADLSEVGPAQAAMRARSLK